MLILKARFDLPARSPFSFLENCNNFQFSGWKIVIDYVPESTLHVMLKRKIYFDLLEWKGGTHKCLLVAGQ